jgi:hypothetical protein
VILDRKAASFSEGAGSPRIPSASVARVGMDQGGIGPGENARDLPVLGKCYDCNGTGDLYEREGITAACDWCNGTGLDARPDDVAPLLPPCRAYMARQWPPLK